MSSTKHGSGRLAAAGALALLLAAGCGDEDAEREEGTGVVGAKDSPTRDFGKADGTATLGGDSFLVSASSVEALEGDLGSVEPPVLTPAGAEAYLTAGSALGYLGPIGPYGPLGTLGPLGDNAWNQEAWMHAAGDWSEWSQDLTGLGGPLSEAGPLGPSGPLSQEAYEQTLPALNDFSKQLQAGGVWTVLGPLGPLGALGALGPLGPVGAHGLEADSGGRYAHDGEVRRTVDVPYEGAARTWGLFEHYDEETAAELSDNDTSFLVSGHLAGSWWTGFEQDVFRFTSEEEQFVTVLLVPEYQLDDLDLDLLDGDGNLVAASNCATLIDWVQIKVPAGTTLEARIKLYYTGHVLSKRYRLYVTGSTQHFTESDITGPHQVGR